MLTGRQGAIFHEMMLRQGVKVCLVLPHSLGLAIGALTVGCTHSIFSGIRVSFSALRSMLFALKILFRGGYPAHLRRYL